MTSDEIPEAVYGAASRAAVDVVWPLALAAGRAEAAKQMLVASALVPELAIRRHLAFLAMKGNPLDVLTDDEAAFLAQLAEPQP